jgi:hypothetical protein
VLLNVSLQNGVEMLELPVCNESYDVDLRKSGGITRVEEGTNSQQQTIYLA